MNRSPDNPQSQIGVYALLAEPMRPSRPQRSTLSLWSVIAGLIALVLALALGSEPAQAGEEALPAVGGASSSSTPRTAEPQMPELVASDLGARIEQLAGEGARRTGATDTRVEVTVGTLDPRLKLAPCTHIEPYMPPGLPAWGSTRIGLRCTAGPKLWNVTLPVTVKVWGRGVVAASALPTGTVLAPQHLTEAEVDLAAGAQTLRQTQAALGRTLARPLGAGAALRQTDLQVRRWFAAGDTVRVVALGAGWRVVSEGQALSPGIEGQNTRVRLESGRMVSGRPVAAREVEVAL